MKKIIIASIISIIFGFIGSQISLVQAASADQSGLLGRLSLPEELRPKNSPTVNIIAGKDTNAEVSYGNFILQLIAGSLLYLAAPTAIFFIVWGGSSYISSRGKQEAMDKAKKTITFAIIGLLFIIFSYIIVQAIVGFVLQSG